MAYDFQNFSWVIGSNSSRTVPDVTVSLQVTDSMTGQVVQDYTGANSFNIWPVFSSLSTADKKDVLNDLVMSILRKKAGL